MLVGRGSAADFTIVDLRLSRAHFRIERRGSDWVLTDLKSHNGTEVNGVPVNGTETLQDQDMIIAGDTHFSVSLHDQSWGLNSTSATKSSTTPKPWWRRLRFRSVKEPSSRNESLQDEETIRRSRDDQ